MAIRLSIIYVILSYARGEKHGINVSSQGAGGILFLVTQPGPTILGKLASGHIETKL